MKAYSRDHSRRRVPILRNCAFWERNQGKSCFWDFGCARRRAIVRKLFLIDSPWFSTFISARARLLTPPEPRYSSISPKSDQNPPKSPNGVSHCREPPTFFEKSKSQQQKMCSQKAKNLKSLPQISKDPLARPACNFLAPGDEFYL